MKKEKAKENTAKMKKKMEILVIYTYKTEQWLLNIFIQRNEKHVKHDINESARHICRI